jgi:hypothetical protein
MCYSHISAQWRIRCKLLVQVTLSSVKTYAALFAIHFVCLGFAHTFRARAPLARSLCVHALSRIPPDELPRPPLTATTANLPRNSPRYFLIPTTINRILATTSKARRSFGTTIICTTVSRWFNLDPFDFIATGTSRSLQANSRDPK